MAFVFKIRLIFVILFFKKRSQILHLHFIHNLLIFSKPLFLPSF